MAGLREGGHYRENLLYCNMRVLEFQGVEKYKNVHKINFEFAELNNSVTLIISSTCVLHYYRDWEKKQFFKGEWPR